MRRPSFQAREDIALKEQINVLRKNVAMLESY